MQIGTRSRWPHRCSCCGTRHTLRMPIDWYVRPPRCRNCGSQAFRVDQWMLKRNTRAMTCTCDGYHFPHRKGSLWCTHYAGELSDEQYETRYFQIPAVV